MERSNSLSALGARGRPYIFQGMQGASTWPYCRLIGLSVDAIDAEACCCFLLLLAGVSAAAPNSSAETFLGGYPVAHGCNLDRISSRLQQVYTSRLENNANRYLGESHGLLNQTLNISIRREVETKNLTVEVIFWKSQTEVIFCSVTSEQ